MSKSPRTIFEASRRAVSTYDSSSHIVGTPAVFIVADSILVGVTQRGIVSNYPPAAVNTALDQIFEALPVGVTLSVTGTWFNKSLVADPIIVTLTASNNGAFAGEMFSTDAIAEVVISVDGDVIIGLAKTNWIKWSNIGEFDFTIDRKNTAGEMPMEWPGTVLAVMKLGTGVVVYGSGGVTQMIPKDNVWVPKVLTSVGIRSEWSITGNQYLHVWIDKKAQLCIISEKLEVLDYSEFLTSMATTTVLSYDSSEQLIYICDGTLGYVYSIEDKSLGTGPPKITGVGYNQGALQIVGSGALVTSVFEITTDLIDCETRNDKTLQELEVGTDATQDLEASVDYRLGYKSSLVSTPWQLVSPSGVAVISCFGKEFKIRLRAKSATALELDYLRVKGFIHGYSPVDT